MSYNSHKLNSNIASLLNIQFKNGNPLKDNEPITSYYNVAGKIDLVRPFDVNLVHYLCYELFTPAPKNSML
jgi:hypothetical protein